ncbi:glycoside hydrolase family 92 protein [Jaapia argillacea MUCL 33604]|uniref:Glycoside hydrolase family 92 protein n=1 Tax=Jaapia argillacea MUCL 33604 TaxID=933084 RepID=A0A067PB92_9AGAM|nr:glycoside hydrolase family 92 protein [Jaapia argillacea MUCL 33604]
MPKLWMRTLSTLSLVVAIISASSILFSSLAPTARAISTRPRLPPEFSVPPSQAVDYVDPLIGNGGDSPNGSGGMIPSTSPPFAMTRWTPATRRNYVSVTPYNYTDDAIYGFQGTHQPAIWMGESGQVTVIPGAGEVRTGWEESGMKFSHATEVVSASYYSAVLEALEGGSIIAEQSSTSRVGHLRFTFKSTSTPYILVEATRPSVMGSADPTNVTYPSGSVSISTDSVVEISGYNPERQDFIIGPNPAPSFAGYFCVRITPLTRGVSLSSFGTIQNGTNFPNERTRNGGLLSAYASFSSPPSQLLGEDVVLDVRIGVSFISVEQARANLDKEIPDGTSLETTAEECRRAWAEKLDRIRIEDEGASELQKRVFWTGVFHTLQYPYEQDEDGRYYSGYDDAIHEGQSYTGYSIWDTYRAEWAWQILLAPERIPGMVQSMLQDYVEGGWLPMWKNIVETNIMVGTHADSLIAEAVIKGITGFDLGLAYEAVYKDATVPPYDDWNISYYDREENVGYEVRAGLSSVYNTSGYVANDIHSESGSRTLDYAYDDYALSLLSAHLAKSQPSSASPNPYSLNASHFLTRSKLASFSLFNDATGFMEARNADGSWAGPDEGWTEGDKWAYTFDIVQDVEGLIERVGGKEKFVMFLDEHFDGGHNDHTNEPSHHIPYLYALAGSASKTQERVREIAFSDYNDTVNGLSGNEDCGQMSAWYIFSALGFYPVNPVSGEYVIGSPLFEKITIDLPASSKPLVITAAGTQSKPYVKSVTLNGMSLTKPIIKHEDIAHGGELVFEMSGEPEEWLAGNVATVEEQVTFHEEL